MAEKLKNKVTDEELKIRATSDEKITVKLTNNYAFQKIFKNAKIVKGFLMALLNLKEYEIKKIEITDPFTLGENNEEKEGEILKLITQVQKKIARGDSLEKIADDLIEDETVIKPIYQLVQGNPNKTEDDIYQMLNLL